MEYDGQKGFLGYFVNVYRKVIQANRAIRSCAYVVLKHECVM